MRELKELKGLRTFLDRRLIEALGHPVREHILAVLNERDASGREIGEELGTDVSAFYHHIEQLEKLGCIERVKTLPKRGAREHIFRAKRTLFFDRSKWNSLPDSIKADLAIGPLQNLFDDVTEGLRTGVLNSREDGHVSWTPAEVDDQGWQEVQDLQERALQQLAHILHNARGRLTERGDRGRPITVSLLAFEKAQRGSGLPTETAPEP